MEKKEFNSYKELVKVLSKFYNCHNEIAIREKIQEFLDKNIWKRVEGVFFERIESQWFECWYYRISDLY